MINYDLNLENLSNGKTALLDIITVTLVFNPEIHRNFALERFSSKHSLKVAVNIIKPI